MEVADENKLFLALYLILGGGDWSSRGRISQGSEVSKEYHHMYVCDSSTMIIVTFVNHTLPDEISPTPSR